MSALLYKGNTFPLIFHQLMAIYIVSECVFGLGRSPGNPLQYSCLENPIYGEAWEATVHGVAKNQTLLSDFTSLQGP